ncbi:MAG: ribulose-phosphate 3-epimerase [Acidimicrobiales bacterium]|jgi:ribulose-phosphate 3-epimerase
MSQNSMLPITVVPSLPAVSFSEIESLCKALEGVAREIQVDIVDGKFVPLVSWPFTEEDPVTALSQLSQFTDSFSLEMDCMVCNPEQYLDIFVTLGVKRVAIHVGSTQAYAEIISHAKKHGYRLGFALTNDTPLDVVLQYIDEIEYVQLMGIKEVGQQGQPFDVRTLARARELRAQFPELEIAVDGSVNANTMPQLYAAGVTRFAPGSAIAKTENPADSYKQLLSLVT